MSLILFLKEVLLRDLPFLQLRNDLLGSVCYGTCAFVYGASKRLSSASHRKVALRLRNGDDNPNETRGPIINNSATPAHDAISVNRISESHLLSSTQDAATDRELPPLPNSSIERTLNGLPQQLSLSPPSSVILSRTRGVTVLSSSESPMHDRSGSSGRSLVKRRVLEMERHVSTKTVHSINNAAGSRLTTPIDFSPRAVYEAVTDDISAASSSGIEGSLPTRSTNGRVRSPAPSTVSSTSRPKSAFQMRDEMRLKRQTSAYSADVVSPMPYRPNTGIDLIQTYAEDTVIQCDGVDSSANQTRDVWTGEHPDSIDTDLKSIMRVLELVLSRGEHNSVELERLNGLIDEMKEKSHEKCDMIVRNERPSLAGCDGVDKIGGPVVEMLRRELFHEESSPFRVRFTSTIVLDVEIYC
jgi:hypothetical protein